MEKTIRTGHESALSAIIHTHAHTHTDNAYNLRGIPDRCLNNKNTAHANEGGWDAHVASAAAAHAARARALWRTFQMAPNTAPTALSAACPLGEGLNSPSSEAILLCALSHSLSIPCGIQGQGRKRWEEERKKGRKGWCQGDLLRVDSQKEGGQGDMMWPTTSSQASGEGRGGDDGLMITWSCATIFLLSCRASSAWTLSSPSVRLMISSPNSMHCL
jgi:hypothetical protein